MRVGMDVGGTTARVRMADEDGNTLYEAEGPGGTLAGIGEEKLTERFRLLLDQAMRCAGTDVSQCARLVLGASGVDTEELKRAYEHMLVKIGVPSSAVWVMNDGELLLNMFDSPSLVLISGTGSIALGTDGGEMRCRCGGWEHLLSDEGSGTWIGMEVLKALVRDEDGMTEAPVLRRLLEERAGLSGAESAMNFAAAHIMEKADIARLAPLADEAARQGDAAAAGILAEAAEHLFTLAEVLVKRICRDGCFSVLFWGSVLLRNRTVRSRLSDKIHAVYPSARILLPTSTALDCAMMLARGKREIRAEEI